MMTKVLIKLLETPVKPEHPIDFIRENLGATQYERNQIEQLEQQVNDYKQEVIDLKSQVDELKLKLSEKDELKVTNGDVVSPVKVAVDNSKTTDDAAIVENTVSNGGGIVDDSTDKKISESEKAVTPVTPTADDIPVIEAAVAEPCAVPTIEDPASDAAKTNVENDKKNENGVDDATTENIITNAKADNADTVKENTIVNSDAKISPDSVAQVDNQK